jgi:hypothetical protein
MKDKGNVFHCEVSEVNGVADEYAQNSGVTRAVKVPDVLLSGHHAEIEKWRAAQSDGHRPTQRGPGRPAAAPRRADQGAPGFDTRATVQGSRSGNRGPGLP